jgi:hypothetical protein
VRFNKDWMLVYLSDRQLKNSHQEGKALL